MSTETETQYFDTMDIYVAAALEALGMKFHSLVQTGNGRKYLFRFHREEGIDDKVRLFWKNKLQVPALSYMNAMRSMKSRLYNDTEKSGWQRPDQRGG